jgi:hypothetical protein
MALPPEAKRVKRELVLVIDGLDDPAPWTTFVRELFDDPTVFTSASQALTDLYDRPRRAGSLPWVILLIGRPSTAASSLLIRGTQAHVHLKDVPVVVLTIDVAIPDGAVVQAAGAASFVRAAASDFPSTLARVADYWLSINVPRGREGTTGLGG